MSGQTGEVLDAPIKEQTRRVLEQLKLCVETAGSSLDQVLKCNVYCTSVEMFPVVNEIYALFRRAAADTDFRQRAGMARTFRHRNRPRGGCLNNKRRSRTNRIRCWSLWRNGRRAIFDWRCANNSHGFAKPIGARLAPTFLWGGNRHQGSRALHHGMLDPDGYLVRFGSQPVLRKRVRLRSADSMMSDGKNFTG
jgi:hypothetical protein